MSAARRAALFLDRDGVVNQAIIRNGKPFAPSNVGDFVILPEAPAACRALRRLGFLLVVVTNQPEVARGNLAWEAIDQMHDVLRSAIELDAIYVCPHDAADGCQCRKPMPGLLLDASRDLGLDLHRSFLVGDRWGDIEAARRAACRAVLIDRHYYERRPEGADAVVGDLAEAATWIRSNLRPEEGTEHDRRRFTSDKGLC